jgi:hypothetical protein
MAPYQYQPLDVSKKEIRILNLHPGSRDDPIRISIEHIPFSPSKDDEPSRISKKRLQKIQNDLPHDWEVYSTLEGRPIFLCCPKDAPVYSSWQSPIATSNEAHSKEADYNRTESFEGAFEAVSYTWGSAQPISLVTIIDAQSPSTYAATCSVGPNLLEMLSHLRRPETNRALWIDAICINQDDPIEKGEQIRRMCDIFKFASRTVMWLGKASVDSTEAVRALEHVGKNLEFTTTSTFIPAPDSIRKNWWNLRHLIPLLPSSWNAIANFIQRPYFERLWVMQEAQMAGQNSIMQCGETEIPWYYARRAFIRCRSDMATLPRFSSLSSRMNQRLAEDISHSLVARDISLLFKIASTRKCADPRDKVFAVFGLLPSNLTQHIQSSYTLLFRDVYIQAFLATVHFTHRLGLLDSTNQHGPWNDHPSWAPDFRLSSSDLHDANTGSYASGPSAAHILYQPPDSLQVRGIYQGQVLAVSPIIISCVRDGYLAVLELVSLHFPYITKEECLGWYVWIVTQGYLKDRWYGHSMAPSLQEAKRILQQTWARKDSEVASKYRQWYANFLSDHQPGKFFVTDRGQLGCGPPIVAPGDKVYVLSGYDKPVLVRLANSTDQSTCYHYMGPPYVYGLMEGQAFLGPLPNPWELIIDNSNMRYSFSFLNHKTGEITQQDPRLDILPQEWHEVEDKDDTRFEIYTQHYKNKTTGETISSDPRLLPEALEARGVHLETITLV